MDLAFSEDALPVRITFEQPLSDEALMGFSAANRWLRVERDADGELIVMSPVGSEGSAKELDVAVELALWARKDARGKAFGSTAGFYHAHTSVRSADAA